LSEKKPKIEPKSNYYLFRVSKFQKAFNVGL